MLKRVLVLLLAALLALPLLAQEPVRRVFTTRHGQRPGRPSKVLKDPYVTDMGREQATTLGKHLKKLGFKGRIYASPYLRTVETAVLIAKEVDAKVYPDAEFQEGVYKDTTNLPNGGHTLAMLRELFPGMIGDDAVLADNWMGSKAEKGADITRRVMKRLDEVMKEHPEGDVLVVGHAGTVQAFSRGFSKRIGEKVNSTAWNCCLVAYGIDKEGKPFLISCNMKHMPEKLWSSPPGCRTPEQNQKAFEKQRAADAAVQD